MVGIKFFPNTITYIFLQIFILNPLVCKEKLQERTLSLINSEVEYDYDKMIDAQKDYPVDDGSYVYSLEIMKAEKDFLKNCNVINDNDSLIGDWILVDSAGKKIQRNSYLFNDYISISKYENNIVFDNWGNRSVLYLGRNNRYYIYTRGIGIIRMIKINEDKLFVYIVQNKNWVLDPIHNDGEYIFRKKNDETDSYNIDMNEWFEKL